MNVSFWPKTDIETVIGRAPVRVFMSLSTLLLLGCEGQPFSILDAITGKKTQTVILVDTPTTVGETEQSYSAPEPMTVVGESVSVCMVLRTSTPLAAQPTMDRLFSESMGSSVVEASLSTSSGELFLMDKPMQAWQKAGVITSTEELMACASCACGPTPEIGTEIKSVSLAASPPLDVLGIYWESTNRWDDIGD
jgi:hypothetical protein